MSIEELKHWNGSICKTGILMKYLIDTFAGAAVNKLDALFNRLFGKYSENTQFCIFFFGLMLLTLFIEVFVIWTIGLNLFG